MRRGSVESICEQGGGLRGPTRIRARMSLPLRFVLRTEGDRREHHAD